MPELGLRDGITLDREHRIIVTVGGISLLFYMEPWEMRSFGAALERSANLIECEAAGAAADVLDRARRGH